jgi:adenine-specific DNA-methyltransferase
MQFRDALVTSVVVAFKKSLPSGNPYINLSSGENLQRPSFVRQVKRPSIGTAGKWSQYFAQTEIFPEVKQNHTISEIFFIKRGLATGSNSFFIIEESVASKLNLPKQFLRAILPGPRSIRSDVIEADKEGFPLGLTRLVLFDCPLPRSAISHVFPTLERYLREGERKGIDQLYLPRSRKPWYSQ